MTIVRQTGGERWAIVESELGSSFREFQACLKCVNLFPVLHHLFLLLRKVEGGGGCLLSGQTSNMSEATRLLTIMGWKRHGESCVLGVALEEFCRVAYSLPRREWLVRGDGMKSRCSMGTSPLTLQSGAQDFVRLAD